MKGTGPGFFYRTPSTPRAYLCLSPTLGPYRAPTFLSSDHAIQAAVRGEGVVLGRSALVADELAAGHLVRPFELSLPAGFAYYVPPTSLRQGTTLARLMHGEDG
jgi:DNA-binding transcriptional LysR family regulator